MASKKRETWKAIGKDLATTPNGAPSYHYQIPDRDIVGNVVSWSEAVQCLLCHKGIKGSKMRHEKSCPYTRAKALLKAERIGKGKQREG